MNVEPIAINGLFTVFNHILPLRRMVSDMIKHRVQHHFHTTAMSFLHEFAENGFVTEMAIDFKVIDGVIFMITWRFKNRTEVQSVNP